VCVVLYVVCVRVVVELCECLYIYFPIRSYRNHYSVQYYNTDPKYRNRKVYFLLNISYSMKKRVDPKLRKTMTTVYLLTADRDYIEEHYPYGFSEFIRSAVHEAVHEDQIRSGEVES
jgi:hypothetical protein